VVDLRVVLVVKGLMDSMDLISDSTKVVVMAKVISEGKTS
jgi:hypothetical protein